MTEQFLARLKHLVKKHGWPWDYARLHDHLHRARDEGRLEIAMAEAEHPPKRTGHRLARLPRRPGPDKPDAQKEPWPGNDDDPARGAK